MRRFPFSPVFVLLALLCIMSPSPGGGACIEYSDYLHFLTSIDLPEDAKDMAVQGNYAYIACGGSGVQIVDISNPESPSIVGSVVPPGNSWQVAISGHRLCVSDSVYDLRVLDATDPVHPVEVGLLVLNDYIRDICLVGRFAYLAMGNTGLVVVDLGILTIPIRVGTLDTPGFAQAVTAENGIAYIGDGTNGLIVADVSDPRNPSVRGRTPIGGEIRDLKMIGGYLCVAAHQGGLVVVNVSNPSIPFLRGTYIPPPEVSVDNVAGFGTNVFITGDGYSLDISEPIPRVVGVAVTAPGTGLAYNAGSIFAVGSSTLSSIDFHNAASPPRIGAVEIPQGGVEDVAISGTHAFVARDQGLSVLDISDPTAPAIVGNVSTLSARSIALSGHFAWLAGGPSGSARLVCVDVADPTSPFVAGQIGLTQAYDVAVSGDFAYVSAMNSLVVVDVSDPTHPLFVTQLTGLEAPTGITVSGNHAYVADYYTGLDVVDISDPHHPFLAGIPQPPFGWGNDVKVAGNHAFVGTSFYGVFAVDITDPAAPRTLGSDPTSYGPEHIDVADGTVYSSSRMIATMFVTDVTDPIRPRYTGHAPLFGDVQEECYTPRGIATSGSAVFVAIETCGIWAFPLQCGAASVDPVASSRSAALIAQPNPMRGSTMLRWSIPRSGDAIVRVLDAGGRLVRTLASAPVSSGLREIHWDGLDEAGRPVAPGVYFLSATAAGATARSKVIKIE